MVRPDRLFRLFRELCLIDAPALREAECVAFVKRKLTDLGLEVREDSAGSAIGGNANNLIARLPATAPGFPRVFLSAHFDTVEPTAGLEIEETEELFRSKSDTILGADNKAGMAPAIEAVESILEDGTPHGDIWLLFSVAEEIGLKGAAAMDLSGVEADLGYVLDTGPPVGTYVTRTGTHYRVAARLIGRPAHSGKDPEKGVSAVQILADAVHGMRLGRVADELTANLGLVKGGSAANVVCPLIEVVGEARGTDLAALQEQIDHMVLRFHEAAERRGGRAEVEVSKHYDGYSLSPEDRVVRRAVAASRSLGLEPELKWTLGGSDANVFNSRGIPTVVVGTGMQKIHTHEEFVTKRDLVETARLAERLLLLPRDVD
ncbi:MAG: M20/M25/M40 family metallo-hydrolase [Fimbriimonadales bacterium]|nr:M20/M25/M40 family metallo-hydrolase [Fimbriimonadales bacterium]